MTLVDVANHGNSYILALQVAASTTFQTVVGEANQTDAMDHIHYPVVDFDETGAIVVDLEPPRAIIVDELGDEEYVTNGIGKWDLNQSWWLSFDFVVPTDHTSEGGTQNEWAWFQLQIKTILSDMLQLGKTGNPVGSKTYMELSSLRRLQGPYRLDPAEYGRPADPAAGKPDVIWHVAYEVFRGF